MNQVTDGYSLAFVPWDYWEKHIDWMAMNGINRPLNMVGQEAIWAETFEAFNVSLDQQASFLVGPAYLDVEVAVDGLAAEPALLRLIDYLERRVRLAAQQLSFEVTATRYREI